MNRNPDLLQSLRSLTESQRRRSLPPPESLPDHAPTQSFLGQMWSPLSSLIALLIVMVSLAMVFVLQTSRRYAVDPMLHDDFAGALRSLQSLDSLLNETVLRSSAGLLPNQDPLVRIDKSLRLVAKYLTTGKLRAPFLSTSGQEAVRKAVEEFGDVLAKKELQIERFKSEAAVLRNSQNYFPIAVRTFVDAAGESSSPSTNSPASEPNPPKPKKKKKDPKQQSMPAESPLEPLGPQVESLLRQVSLFSLQPLPMYVPQIERRLGVLEERRSSLGPEQQESLRLIIAHARIIVDRQHRIDASVRSVLAFPTRDRGDAARRLYESHVQAAIRLSDSYRISGALLGILLVALSAALVILKLRRSAKALDRERQLAETLLLNVLPKPIAERLKLNPDVIADSFPTATVLFADLVGFSQLSARLPAIELVRLLNRIFSSLDLIAEHHGLEKIKTIGDAYMVVSGLPLARPDHAQAMADFALAAIDELSQIRTERGENLQFRIGINSGSVIAGVIGVRKFAYDLWGDTVNIASRMEMHGIPDAIHCAESTYQLLKDRYEFTARGSIPIKGIGPMQTYLLTGHKKA